MNGKGLEPLVPLIRDAAPDDAGEIAALITSLGFAVAAADVVTRLAGFRAGQAVLVAELQEVVGVITTDIMHVLHRPRPVGRLSMLIVAEPFRDAGIGRALVAAAEIRLAAAGCGLAEVTSNERLAPAHMFYEALGYERTSFRFAKSLVP